MAKLQQHRKQVRRFHRPGDFHELTFSTYRRMPILTNDDWRERLARSIDRAGEETRVELVGFVFMPEHVHLLVYPLSQTGDIDKYLAGLKQSISKQIKAILTATQTSPPRETDSTGTPRQNVLSVLAGRTGL